MSQAARGALVERIRKLKKQFVPDDFRMRLLDRDPLESRRIRTGLIYPSQLNELQACHYEAIRVAQDQDSSAAPAPLRKLVLHSEAAQHCDRLISFCGQLCFNETIVPEISTISEDRYVENDYPEVVFFIDIETGKEFPDPLIASSGLTPPKKRGGGRKPTNLQEDEQIQNEWNTDQYSDYAELAQALGKTKREVEAALERQRKRRNKTKSMEVINPS